MKVKNLFKSLAIVALIVPFLFGLTACGKGKSEVKTVAATEVYETFRTALVSYNQEQTEEPNKFMLDTDFSLFMTGEGGNEKSTIGLNLDDQQFFTYSASGDDISVTFVKDVENAKRVYTYTLTYVEEFEQETPTLKKQETKTYKDYSTNKAGQDKSEWETYFEEMTQNYSTGVETEGTGYPAGNIEITEQTTFEEFKELFVSAMNGEPDVSEGQPQISLENVKFSGKKYKDGSIGFVISISQPVSSLDLLSTTENEENSYLMIINAEYVIKDNKIVGITFDSKYTASLPDLNGNKVDVVMVEVNLSANIKRDYDETKIAEYTADVSNYIASEN